MSAMTFACVAVLAVVGLAVYAIHRKASLKVSAKAPGKFEVSIEVASRTGVHHDGLSSEPAGEPSGLGKLANPTQANQPAAQDAVRQILGQ